MSLLGRQRPKGAVFPGVLGYLPLTLQLRLSEAVRSGKLRATEIDPSVIEDLCQMPQEAAIECIDRFLATNLSSVFNKSGFMIGVIARYKKETGIELRNNEEKKKKTNEQFNPESTIHVHGLASGLNSEVLAQVFSCIGPIVSLRLGTGYAFIEYSQKEQAEAALSLTGTALYGSTIYVDPLAPKEIPGFNHVTSPAALEALASSQQEHHATKNTTKTTLWGTSRRRSPSYDSSSQSSEPRSSREKLTSKEATKYDSRHSPPRSRRRRDDTEDDEYYHRPSKHRRRRRRHDSSSGTRRSRHHDHTAYFLKQHDDRRPASFV